MDPLIRWTTSWIHGSIWRCSPWDGDELRHHEDMHNVHSHVLLLLSRTPLRWCVWSCPPYHERYDILQMSAHGWWWTPPPRPRILESRGGQHSTWTLRDPVLVWWEPACCCYPIASTVVAVLLLALGSAHSLHCVWCGLHPHGPILDPEVGIHPPAIW